MMTVSNIAVHPKSDRVCLMLMPMEIGGENLRQLAAKYAVNIAEVVVHDWDNALTPWPAKGVMPNDPDFEGNAAQTLSVIREQVIPAIKHRLGSEALTFQLVGVSLSGLFAVWAWTQGDDFTDIASISGSFWYDNFASWLSQQHVKKSGFAYLSLGDKEGETKVKRFQPVVADTAQVESTLRKDGATVVFEQTKGTHYAPIVPRLELALQHLPQ